MGHGEPSLSREVVKPTPTALKAPICARINFLIDIKSSSMRTTSRTSIFRPVLMTTASGTQQNNAGDTPEISKDLTVLGTTTVVRGHRPKNFPRLAANHIQKTKDQRIRLRRRTKLFRKARTQTPILMGTTRLAQQAIRQCLLQPTSPVPLTRMFRGISRKTIIRPSRSPPTRGVQVVA